MTQPHRPPDDGLLDEDTLEVPRWLSGEDLYAETGSEWRRRDHRPFDLEDDQ